MRFTSVSEVKAPHRMKMETFQNKDALNAIPQ